MTMYLLIFILFTLIAIFWMKVFLNFKPEDSIGVLWLGSTTVLYVFYCADFLKMGAYILIAVNFGLFIISALYVLKKRNLSNLLKTVIADKASIIYVTYLLLLFTVVHNKVPFWGDELRYWASLPKVLYQYSGALQLHNGYQSFSVDYIPGISVYQYFLQVINGNWSDSLLFFGYGAITGAMVLPITKNIKKWWGGLFCVLVMYMLPLFFFNTKNNDYAIFYQSLYIDPIVGLSAGYITWLVMSGDWNKKITILKYALCTSFLCIIKSSGIVFVIITHMVVLLYFIKFKRVKKDFFNLLNICGMALPIILWELWNVLIKIYGIKKELNYNLGMFLDITFLKEFCNALLFKPIFKPWFYKIANYFTFASCMMLLALIVLFVHKVLQKTQYIEEALLNYTSHSLIIQVIVYVIGLYGLCVGTFGGRLNSYARYISTVCEMIAVFSVCCMVYYHEAFAQYIKKIWNENNDGKPKIEVMICIGTGIALVLISPVRPVNNYRNTYPDYIVKDGQAVAEIFSTIRNSDNPDSWATVALLYDEPNWESDSWVSWSKQWYGHLLNNLNYESITYNTQIKQKHYYTSQMTKRDVKGEILLELTDGDEWQQDIEYIVWLHGNYVETPIYAWELYKIEKIDEKKVEMQMMSLGSKPKEFYNYH
ncbi:Uncharacterised protein [uncultured Clostridium sp.]|jgi:hypothetical protein|nr:Uncharacterised protein [uncultured Clostridium sp.]